MSKVLERLSKLHTLDEKPVVARYKVCTKCTVRKPNNTDHFYQKADDSLATICKKCKIKSVKANTEKINGYKKKKKQKPKPKPKPKRTRSPKEKRYERFWEQNLNPIF